MGEEVERGSVSRPIRIDGGKVDVSIESIDANKRKFLDETVVGRHWREDDALWRDKARRESAEEGGGWLRCVLGMS